MKEAVITELNIFPVKSCRKVSLDEAKIDRYGVAGDRTLMVAYNGKTLAQRSDPQMAQISVTLLGDGRFVMHHDELDDFTHELVTDGPTSTVGLLRNDIETYDQGDVAAEWFSKAIGKDVRLVSAAEQWLRKSKVPYAVAAHDVPTKHLTDVMPVLLCNQASMDDLNTRLDHKISIDNFRPNIVVEGLDPYEEDDIHNFANDDAYLVNSLSCERCIMVTTHQQTGTRPDPGEPLKTLSTYRQIEKRYASGILFGVYVQVMGETTLKVGDKLYVDHIEG